MQILENLVLSVGNSLPQKEYSVIIDAVFGIGLSREIRGEYADVIEKMNQMSGYKVAVDIPSGVRSDDGKVLGVAFKAELTVDACIQGSLLQHRLESPDRNFFRKKRSVMHWSWQTYR